MATALHSRYLHTTNITDQHADAEKQLTALEEAQELELTVEADIVGYCLDVQFSGSAEKVAEFVKNCDSQAIFITQVSPGSEEERELLREHIGKLTEIAE